MYDKISVQADIERQTFEQEVTLPNGSTFDNRKTVKMIGYHRLGQFFECSESDAIFYSLGQKREPHFAKKLDTDSKDYEVTGEGENAYRKSWVANIKLRTWFRESGFALDLNDNSEECAAYGSSVMKLVPNGNDDELKLCNLLYLWFDPTVENIIDSPIIELHQLTEYQVRKMKGWKNVDLALKKAEKVEMDTTANAGQQVIDRYKFWERTGEFQRKGKDGKYTDKDPVYYHAIFCGYGEDEVIVSEEVIKPEDCLYIDFHISKYEDRWLRIGVYERLFHLQELVNELVNNDREASIIASLLLLQSPDKTLIGRNALQEAFSGMILDTASRLSQVQIDNRAVGEFLNKLLRYEQKADELCMTPEVVTGDRLPSGSTFRGQAVLTNVANDAFKNPRDRIGFKMAEFILTKKLPKLMAKWNTEDVMEISASEPEAKMYDYYAMQEKVNEFVRSYWDRDENPKPEEIEKFKEEVRTKWSIEGRKLTDLKGFFKFKYSLRLNPTGENINKEQKNEVFSNILPLLREISPTAFEDALRQYLEYNGISPIRIPMDEMRQMQEAGRQNIPTPQPKNDKLMSMINNG